MIRSLYGDNSPAVFGTSISFSTSLKADQLPVSAPNALSQPPSTVPAPLLGFNHEIDTPGSAYRQTRVLINPPTDLAAFLNEATKTVIKLEEDIDNVQLEKKRWLKCS